MLWCIMKLCICLFAAGLWRRFSQLRWRRTGRVQRDPHACVNLKTGPGPTTPPPSCSSDQSEEASLDNLSKARGATIMVFVKYTESYGWIITYLALFTPVFQRAHLMLDLCGGGGVVLTSLKLFCQRRTALSTLCEVEAANHMNT